MRWLLFAAGCGDQLLNIETALSWVLDLLEVPPIRKRIATVRSGDSGSRIWISDYLNLYAHTYNDPTNRTDPDGKGSLWVFGSDCPIYGKAQTTGSAELAPAGVADAQRMAASGKYSSVHLNQKLSTTTGSSAAGGQQPDVAGVTKGTGAVDTVEHPSTSQTSASQDTKGGNMQARLAEIGRRGTHETSTTGPAIGEAGAALSGKTGKVLGAAGMVIGVPGAMMESQKIPNMSTIEFMYRAAGMYEVAIEAGLLPPTPEIY